MKAGTIPRPDGHARSDGVNVLAGGSVRGRFHHSPHSSQAAKQPASLLTRTKCAGFTLIEILAAFVIFVLAFGAVLQALSGSIHNTVQSRGYTEAALTARSLMDELEATGQLRPGTVDGELDGGYRYELHMDEYVPEDAPAEALGIEPAVRLYRIELTVYWGGERRQRERRATFTTLRALSGEP